MTLQQTPFTFKQADFDAWNNIFNFAGMKDDLFNWVNDDFSTSHILDKIIGKDSTAFIKSIYSQGKRNSLYQFISYMIDQHVPIKEHLELFIVNQKETHPYIYLDVLNLYTQFVKKPEYPLIPQDFFEKIYPYTAVKWKNNPYTDNHFELMNACLDLLSISEQTPENAQLGLMTAKFIMKNNPQELKYFLGSYDTEQKFFHFYSSLPFSTDYEKYCSKLINPQLSTTSSYLKISLDFDFSTIFTDHNILEKQVQFQILQTLSYLCRHLEENHIPVPSSAESIKLSLMKYPKYSFPNPIFTIDISLSNIDNKEGITYIPTFFNAAIASIMDIYIDLDPHIFTRDNKQINFHTHIDYHNLTNNINLLVQKTNMKPSITKLKF